MSENSTKKSIHFRIANCMDPRLYFIIYVDDLLANKNLYSSEIYLVSNSQILLIFIIYVDDLLANKNL